MYRIFIATQNIRVISREVQQALTVGQPIVALESTVITHGMPHPSNLQWEVFLPYKDTLYQPVSIYSTAIELEEIVRKNGAVPATIGILDGHIHIGECLCA